MEYRVATSPDALPRTHTPHGRLRLMHADSVGFFLLALVGSIFQVIAYASVAPVIAGLLFTVFGLMLLAIGGPRWSFERRGFVWTFSICWLWAGVAAIFATQFGDPFQNSSDAAIFYDLAARETSGLAVDEIRMLAEGGGVIVIWRTLYEVFSFVGLGNGRYVGISANVFLVAMTGVIAVRIVRTIFGDDEVRVKRMILLFSFCGLFWLFASIHLRDAAVLFAVTALTFIWVRYLKSLKVTDLLVLVAASVVALVLMGYLRTEFAFVPVALLFAGTAATATGPSSRQTRPLWTFAAVVTAIVFGLAIARYREELLAILMLGNTAYSDFALEYSANSSLGASLVVKAPMPLRLLLGSAYLYVFPIPVWAGFQLESAYHLLKSLHAVYIYIVFPLAALGAWHAVSKQDQTKSPLMFLFFVMAGFTLVVAATSLETRHLGAFLVSFLVLAVVPNLEDRLVRRTYTFLVLSFLGVISVGHASWALIKFA